MQLSSLLPECVEKIIEGLLDEPATKKPSGGGPTGVE